MSKKKTILIADCSKELLKQISDSPLSKNFQITSTTSGFSCKEKIDKSLYDLVIIDQSLDEMHGIELLRFIKTNSHTKKMGVIITSDQPLYQNHKSAIDHNADFFLEKPFTINHLFSLIDQFFDKKLSPNVLPIKTFKPFPKKGYKIKSSTEEHCLNFWGTRGTHPVSGPDTIRYGGNTSCLEVRYGDDLLIIDAGSGIRPLGKKLSSEGIKKIHLYLSHTHWDHIIGFPFFDPIYDPRVEITIGAPVGYEKRIEEVFEEMFSSSYFPIRFEEIQAKINFIDLRTAHTYHVGKIKIEPLIAIHPGSTICFKIQMEKISIGYITDNELFIGYQGDPKKIDPEDPLLTPYRSQIKELKGCDILIHEAQYFPEEYETKAGWGHSSITNACAFVSQIKPKLWIITHHDPNHTDTDLEKKYQLQKKLMDTLSPDIAVKMAFDGMTIPL